MRNILALLCLALLLPTVSKVRAVEFTDGPPIGLQITASSSKVSIGQPVRLTVSASDIDYEMGQNNIILEQVNDPVTLTWEAPAGSITRLNVGVSPVELKWTAPIRQGVYSIFFTADDSGRYSDEPAARRIIEVTVTTIAGGQFTPSIRVTANPTSIRLGREGSNSSQITAQVLDKQPGGKQVRFFATLGTLSASTATTNGDGIAVVRLTASEQDVGTSEIAAFYGNTSASTTVEISRRRSGDGGPSPSPPPPPTYPGLSPSDFSVDVSPPSLPADGQSTAIVTVRIVDFRGLGIPRQLVYFRATMGALRTAVSLTDLLGYARTEIVAPTIPGNGLILVESGALRGYGTIAFTAPPSLQASPLPRIFLTVNPTDLPADGNSASRIEALVLDDQGRVLIDAPVSFATTLGSIGRSTGLTDENGKASTSLVSPDHSGTAVVTAYFGGVTAASQVSFSATDASPVGLTISRWAGQLAGFVAGNWLLNQVQLTDNDMPAMSQILTILDASGGIAEQFQLSKDAVLIRDQYGMARGYVEAGASKGNIVLLDYDGRTRREWPIDLPSDSRLVNAWYADPAGQVVITASQPDGAKPAIYFFAADGTKLLSLSEGLSGLPAAALGGDGYLAVAANDSAIRLYTPQGAVASEIKRERPSPVLRIAVGPGGSWFGTVTGRSAGDDQPSTISFYSRQGNLMTSFEAAALDLSPAGDSAALARTNDRSLYLDINSGRVLWSIRGGYGRFLATKNQGIIAGQYDENTGKLLSRVIIVRLSDGVILQRQDFNDLQDIRGVAPLDADGMVRVVATAFTFEFQLPPQ